MKLSCTLPLGKSRYGVSGNALERVLSKSFLSRSQKGGAKELSIPLNELPYSRLSNFFVYLAFQGEENEKNLPNYHIHTTYGISMYCRGFSIYIIMSKGFLCRWNEREGKIPTTSCQTNPLRYYPNWGWRCFLILFIIYRKHLLWCWPQNKVPLVITVPAIAFTRVGYKLNNLP